MFIFQALEFSNVGAQLRPQTSVNDFRNLFSVTEQDELQISLLNSFCFLNATISTAEEIAGTYVCEGQNDYGSREANFTIAVEG